MKIESLIQLGKLTAIVSFLTGTAIFVLFVFTQYDGLFLFGYYFLLVASIINLCVLLWITTTSTNDSKLKKALRNATILILSNIPVAAIYIIGIMTLLSYMRITIVNKTNSEISNIRIYGCDEENIAKLRPNEQAKKWILINGDCMIGLKYAEKGIQKEETIASYVSGPMGQKIRYEIGGKSDWEF